MAAHDLARQLDALRSSAIVHELASADGGLVYSEYPAACDLAIRPQASVRPDYGGEKDQLSDTRKDYRFCLYCEDFSN